MAYNRYQYETSPRKLQPEYEPERKKYPKKKSTAKKVKPVEKPKTKVKRKAGTQMRVMAYVGIGFLILFAIGYRNSQITESFAKVKSLKSDLAVLQKENQQLEVNIENNLNLKSVEQSAKELLGMQKLDNKQTVYINLPKQDYIEPATEEIVKDSNVGWIQKIINTFMGK